MCLSVRLSFCVLVCLSVCLYIHLSISLSVCLSVCVCVGLAACLSVRVFVCVCMRLSVCLSVCVICLPILPSVSPSVCVSVVSGINLRASGLSVRSLWSAGDWRWPVSAVVCRSQSVFHVSTVSTLWLVCPGRSQRCWTLYGGRSCRTTAQHRTLYS